MSSKFDQTQNQFKVNDSVKEKGKNQVMIIISNIPSDNFSEIEHYLKTDKFLCKWKDDVGEEKTQVFNGANLECA